MAAGRPLLGVTERWVKDFVRRKAAIIGSLFKGYVSPNFQHPSGKEFTLWYDNLLLETNRYDVPPDQVFSLCVSGLQMGCVAKVFSSGENIDISSDQCDWITIIDCLFASGGALDPYITFRGRHHQMDRFNQDIPSRFVVNSCLKTWSKADILVKWLQDHFIPFLNSKTPSKHSILIVDTSRHVLNEEFLAICEEENIRVIPTLQHLPDHMHQLDITLIGNLKKFYNKYTQKKILAEKDDQLEFWYGLFSARKAELTEQLIQRRFKRSGVMPVDYLAAWESFMLLYAWGPDGLYLREDSPYQ